MNRIGLYLTGLFVSVLFLTSCLKGSNVQEGYACGVIGVGKDYFTPVLKTNSGDFYSSNLSSFNLYDGDCCFFYFRLDSDIPENSPNYIESSGYYTISLLQLEKINKYYLSSHLMNSISTALPDEVSVSNGYSSGDYVENHLFITQIVNQPSDMELSWRLEYDEQTMMPTTDENNKRYYDLYIRATVKKEGEKTAESEKGYLNAYYMYNYFATAASKEKELLGSNYSASSSKFTVRFNYASSINKETNAVTWQSYQVEDNIAWFVSN